MDDQYDLIIKSIPQNVSLVAVSKNNSVDKIRNIYNKGQRIFGENRVQELQEKQPQLPSDIQWHLIGHLQTNKVKYIAPYIALIESVDSEKLLKEINRQANINSRTIAVLLQLKIAEEEQKTGLDLSTLHHLLEKAQNGDFPHVKIRGLMGIGSLTNDYNKTAGEFEYLKSIFDQYKNEHGLDILSMGMSSDYELAIDKGSTSVRIGSAIFGSRNGT